MLGTAGKMKDEIMMFSMKSYTWRYQCWITSRDLPMHALCGRWLQSRGPAKRDK